MVIRGVVHGSVAQEGDRNELVETTEAGTADDESVDKKKDQRTAGGCTNKGNVGLDGMLLYTRRDGSVVGGDSFEISLYEKAIDQTR